MDNSNPVVIKKFDLFFSSSSTAKILRYKKRDLILNPNDTPTSVFYIKSGYLRVFRISEQGEELTLTILKPTDLFPLTYGLSDVQNAYYIEAITPMELCKVPQDHFLKFVKENPEILYELTNRILVKFDGVLSRIEYLIFSNAYIKIATTILICAKKFGIKRENDLIIQVPLTHRDISTLVGITRETTSLEIKKLENKGYLCKERKLFVVKNFIKLEEEIMMASHENNLLHNSL